MGLIMRNCLFIFFMVIALSGCQDFFISSDEKISMAEAQIRGGETNYEILEKVIGWLEEEADEGNSEAMYWLARAHYKGLGVEKNHKEMVDFLKAGAAKGHTQSIYRLGQAFHLGLGVDQDIKEAVEYYERAIDLGSHDAEGALAQLLYYSDRYEDVEQNFAKSFRLAKQGADGGSDFAMSILATHYFDLQSPFYSPQKAVETLEKIIARGNPSKTMSDELIRKDRMVLAYLYMGGPDESEGVKNLEKAERLLTENAQDPALASQAYYFLAALEKLKMAEVSDEEHSDLIESRRSYLRKSAALGKPEAAQMLCSDYAVHWQDESHEYYKNIRHWCLIGAENGHPTSQFNTAVMLKDEKPAEALSWFALASFQGHSEAGRIVDTFSAKLTVDQRARAIAKTRRFLKNNPDLYKNIQRRILAQ